MKPLTFSIAKGFTFFLLALPTISQAKPWIEPTDLHLRSDLQLLANAGIITVPITTYPLMWNGVISDIRQNSRNAKTQLEVNAVHRVTRAHRSSQGVNVSLELGAGSEASRFQHFGTPMREKGEVTAGISDANDWWAFNLQATYAYDAQDNENVRLDGSYLAAIVGNWVVSAGYQQQWYGPGWDSALTMSTNARPLPSVNVTRHSPEAFNVPILEWLGPWTLTTGIGWMDDDRYMQDTLLWTFRGTIKPHPNFEFGVSRTAQICGSNSQSGVEKSCDLNTWWKMLIGDTNDYDSENPANQLASIDMRWGDTIAGYPYSLYWESMGEDAARLDRFPPFQAKSYLYGADLSYQLMNQAVTTFFEYSETYPQCTNQGNCAYEHVAYKSGYRYHERVMGSTYDNDANTYTLGFIGQSIQNQHRWGFNLRYLELNKNGRNANESEGGGNKVSPNGEDTWNVDVSYYLPAWRGEIGVGAEYSFVQYREGKKDENNVAGWVQWAYQF
ncbi:capsule assembly Wzi family protein [Vibrio sp. FNV 38]|nr:capsule assembly Wzi family protein [Vibrio sp. FNV 38]